MAIIDPQPYSESLIGRLAVALGHPDKYVTRIVLDVEIDAITKVVVEHWLEDPDGAVPDKLVRIVTEEVQSRQGKS